MKDSSAATERVGRYQLLEPIGGGPNGVVARAKVFGVAGFERQFAVKRFLAELTSGPAAQALSAAARSYGSLEHPRIARMSEFGVAQGQTFTAVEYVAGLDVFRLLQEAKLANVAIAAGGALALVSQAARAVGYAHGRGLSHLGLSPTNVIVTADGDVKVTDFGILAATMPPRPAESARLASRVPYLSPEQVAGEATSAATDVFVLGVIAYELVTGQRAYRGESAAQIAQAILGGPPTEPALPRPIVRVLQRCLARSPFERFPDARALADALDAALRVAPVPGTRKDVGAQVKTTLERYALLNEGNVSGMVALNFGGAPVSDDKATQPIARRPEARTEPSPMPTFSPPLPRVGGLANQPGSSIPKPAATMTGLGPPPGVPKFPTSKPAIPSIPTTPMTPPTKVSSLTQGWDAMPDPTADHAPDYPSGTPSGPTTIPDPNASVTDEPIFELPSEDESDPAAALAEAPAASPRQFKPTPGHSFESTTGEMSMGQLDSLNKRAQLATSELMPMQHPSDFNRASEMNRPGDAITKPVNVVPTQPEASAADSVNDFAADPPAISMSLDEPNPAATMPSLAPPPPARPVSQPSISVPGMPAPTTSAPMPHATPSSKLPRIAGIVLAVGVLGAGGYYAYNEFIAKKSDTTTTVAMGSGSAVVPMNGSGSGSAETPVAAGSDSSGSGEGSTQGSGSALAAGSNDAGSAEGSGSAMAAGSNAAGSGSAEGSNAAGSNAAGSNAGSGTESNAGSGGGDSAGSGANTVQPAQKSDQFEVTSTPPGARVFLDGAELGKSPVKQPGSADRHTLAVLLPGHALYVAEVEGAGVYNVALDPVKSAKSGPGIKIENCKVKNRYYIFVDGQPSGQTCPTEKRIVTTLGSHVVEVYDILTETRKKYDVDIKDDRLSVRVKIDE